MLFRSSPLRIVLAAACLLGSTVLPAHAGTVKYPKAKPVFTLDIPEGWTYTEDDNDMHELTISPKDGGDDPKYQIKLLTLAGVHPDSASSLLDTVVAATLKTEGFTDTSSTPAKEVKTPAGMPVSIASAKCKSSGEGIQFAFAMFSPVKGMYCELAGYSSTPEGQTETEKVAENMLGSVKVIH